MQSRIALLCENYAFRNTTTILHRLFELMENFCKFEV